MAQEKQSAPSNEELEFTNDLDLFFDTLLDMYSAGKISEDQVDAFFSYQKP